jgi:hypothetical protein
MLKTGYSHPARITMKTRRGAPWWRRRRSTGGRINGEILCGKRR